MVYQSDRILLGLKKRGPGTGRWNGFGGKVEDGETVEAAARRELQEEAGIGALDLELAAVIDFSFRGETDIWQVHIFRAAEFTGDPQESSEMRPQWFPLDAIPYEEMWPDDKIWLPRILAGEKFRGKFLMDGYDAVLQTEIEVVENFNLKDYD